ncbi:MAG: murein hydrolase activator EnvC family protein [Flavobacteriaceae bacterium]
MKNRSLRHLVLVILLSLTAVTSVVGQSKKQRQLESQRKTILKEIQQINSLLAEAKSEETSLLTKIEDVNLKIKVRKNLIQITNQQANLLTREIKTNSEKIKALEHDLTARKKDYAAMVVKSYKNKATQSKLLFLLSSNDFLQAYKRYNYMKQYKRYQKNQADSIVSKTEKLIDLNDALLLQKEDKTRLIAENKKAQAELQAEKNKQQTLIATLKKDESKYKKAIADKQKESNRIERKIEKLIRDAIAAANKKAKKTSSSKTLSLTPEAKALAASFSANKGKLPWPVSTGRVIQKFGKQRHATIPGIYTNSSGVKVLTSKNSDVKSVFNGVVTDIQVIKGANQSVYIQHGNYFTVYSNLKQLRVKKGDKVLTGMPIGKIASNNEGKSVLRFFIFNNSNKQNPAHWIYKM